MKIVVNGGGPSGLYFALLARRRLGANVTVYERDPKGATYGFGIVLADRGLNRLRDANEESYRMLMESSFVSRHRILSHRGEKIFIDGGGYGGAIARLRLLEILEDCCVRAGVQILHNTQIKDFRELDADLIVGADGANSATRTAQDDAFGTTSYTLSNKLAWYGSKTVFPYPILSFRQTDLGRFWAVAYAYTESMSTFVAECDAQTWDRSLAHLSDDERTAVAESVFAAELEGRPLIGNKSVWNSLPVTRVREWSVGKTVLIGDALHSAHPSIGSGTRIAMEDAIALWQALDQASGDVETGLALFRTLREPTKAKLVTAAEQSIDWYEKIADRLDTLTPIELVCDYMTRTGRVDALRMRQEFPFFMEQYGPDWAAFGKAA